MGTNCSGYIFWGFAFEENEELPWGVNAESEDFEDWEDFFGHRIGLVPPVEDYATDQPIYIAYWQKKRQAIENSGCQIDWSGDANWAEQYPYVHITESGIYSAAPQLESLDPPTMIVQTSWQEKLKQFCELMQIPWKEPGWFLTSSYG